MRRSRQAQVPRSGACRSKYEPERAALMLGVVGREASHASRVGDLFRPRKRGSAPQVQKKPGLRPAFFYIVFKRTLKNLELLINREPEVTLIEIGAAPGIKVPAEPRNVIHGKGRRRIKDVIDAKGDRCICD